ncbi:ExeM/NucH family extracellular endonuclease [Dyadobacter sp. CY326]|uniref:ExeM/NucH family extracellular endonuclease n=1 Tax=Dyadobacter sp. CY326 TaxID=2907300 RepID=UPI001F17FCD4|nr:ExeM/NucH family extracellular endonuclease [Dyadobacter sp. CY326]MCE7067029.1 ExeM/NucH family extracellular endonuclease [Dyadobacter sp. CY326]
MKRFFSTKKWRVALIAAWIFGISAHVFAQTQPPAQPLPFSFTQITGSTLPDGVGVHRFGTTSAAIPTTRTTSPANGDLPYLTGATAGGWQNAGTNGENGIAILASGSNAAGAVVISINTLGKTNVLVEWTARTIQQQASRDNSLALQYRIGDTGDFSDLGTAADVYSTAGTTAGTSATFSLTLPAALENQNLVQLRWVYWESSVGTTGSRDRIALDDVTIGESVSGPDVIAPVISSLSPQDDAANVQLTTDLVLTFSENVVKKTGAFTITNTTDNTTQVIDIQSANVVLSNQVVTISGVTLANSKSYSVTLSAGAFSDAADNDFAGITDPATWNFTTIAAPGATTKISAIQGSGQLAALTGDYTIEGVVTRTFIGATGLNGFYVQEEDADADADPATSEGIFVFNVAADPVGVVTPNQGDKVNITGTVVDFVSTTSGVTTRLTELKTLTNFTNLGPATLPTPVAIQLPVANVADLERYEGMLTELSAATGNLTVTEFFELGRYGQVLLSATGSGDQAGTDARLDQFTQFNAPDASAYSAYLAENAKRQILLDDGSTRQNPDPIIFGRGGNPLSASNTLRGGDQVTSILGILDERLEGYRIQTATGVNFLPSNPRPVTPPALTGGPVSGSPTLTVASANVLNYFVNLDASGDLYRGANTAEEFTRQKAKIIKALIRSGADLIGLMEIQYNGNTTTTALEDLVNGLNADPESSADYAFINPSTANGPISTDAITVGIVYKIGKVTPKGNAAILTTSAAFDLVGRRPLAQTFTQNTNGEEFTVVVNHFKSKGSSSGGEGDADAGDGQGFSNGTRSRQATDLANWLALKPTGSIDPDYLILGDLNAYAKEEPLTILQTKGYQNLLPATSYSYVFDGQIGSLDHALASVSLSRQVTGAAKWHINADEPSVMDYNTEFKSPGQVTSLYNADQFRSADHDPVLIGLSLDKALPVTYISFNGTAYEQAVELIWKTANEQDNMGFDVLKSVDGKHFEKIGFVAGQATTSQVSDYKFKDIEVQPGQIYYYQLKQNDFKGTSELSRIITVKTPSNASNYAVYPNPNQGIFTLSAQNVDIKSVKMYSITGQLVSASVSNTEGAHTLTIKAKGALTPGLYYIQFTANGLDNHNVKLIVR